MRPITYYLCKNAKGDGISEIEKSVAMHRGIMQKRLGPLKLLVSAITIGSGGSAGREGPMGQIGSGFASLIFYKVKLTTHERRLLLVCGLVAGLSALYNAPVGAALFGFEVLLHSFDIFISIPVFLASIIGYAVSIIIFGTNPVIEILPVATIYSFPLIILYIVFGILMGLISVGWTKVFHAIRKFFLRFPIGDQYKPALGAILVGIFAMLYPTYGFAGTGNEALKLALFNLVTPGVLIFIGVGKMLCTSSTVGSGGSGGAFFPTLVIGGCFGKVIGKLFQIILPNTVTTPELFAVMGMSALFAGVSQAPLAITFLVAEMTENYFMVGPLIIVSITSFAVSILLFKGSSFYTIPLEDEKFPFKIWSFIKLQQSHVDQIMQNHLITVNPYATVGELETIGKKNNNIVPVINACNFLGYFTPAQIEALKAENIEEEIIMDKIPLLNPVFVSASRSLQEVVDFLDEYHLDEVAVIDKLQDGFLFRGVIGWNEIYTEQAKIVQYKS